MEGFVKITEKYRKKHYPKGYFKILSKPADGIGAIICGVLLLLWGGGSCIRRLIIICGSELIGDEKNKEIVALVPGMVFILAFSIFSLWFGIRIIWKGREKEISKFMEISGYTESDIEEFEAQLLRPDAIAFQTYRSGADAGILTADYLIWFRTLTKISDVTGAYLVSLPDNKYSVSFSKKDHIYLSIFCKNRNLIFLKADQDRAEYLTALLLAKNPDIDTAGGAVLTEERYKVMVSEMQMRIRL